MPSALSFLSLPYRGSGVPVNDL